MLVLNVTIRGGYSGARRGRLNGQDIVQKTKIQYSIYVNNINTTFAKKDIQNRFNISLATVNNWIKTGVIPSPENGYYTKDVYSNLVKSIENNKGKLQSRANRCHLNTSNIIFLVIKDKKRKELLF